MVDLGAAIADDLDVMDTTELVTVVLASQNAVTGASLSPGGTVTQISNIKANRSNRKYTRVEIPGGFRDFTNAVTFHLKANQLPGVVINQGDLIATSNPTQAFRVEHASLDALKTMWRCITREIYS